MASNPKFEIPSIKGGSNIKKFPVLPESTEKNRVRRTMQDLSPTIFEVEEQGYLVRPFEAGFNDSGRGEYRNVSGVELLLKYAKDIRDFWSDFEEKFDGVLKLPVFDVHIGQLPSGKDGVVMTVEKIEPYDSSDQEELDQKMLKCERMWEQFIRYLNEKKFFEDRVWWDNKKSQFVYGKADGESEPSWYLVDLDLITQEYAHENKITYNLQEKYTSSLDSFYAAGNISQDFYNRARRDIVSSFEK